MTTNVSWNKALEPLGYRGPNSDLMHGQGSNPWAGWISCIRHKVMLCKRDAVPRKRKFGYPVHLCPFCSFSFLSHSDRSFPWKSYGQFCSFVFSISILGLFPFLFPLSFIPFYPLPFLLDIFPSLLLLSLYLLLLHSHTELWPPSSVPMWSLHDPPFIPLLSLFLCFIFSSVTFCYSFLSCIFFFFFSTSAPHPSYILSCIRFLETYINEQQ